MEWATETPPEGFRRAIEEFNRRQFFECHETLEELWKAERRDLRYFYQGILQIGVGYYKIISRPNYRGALSLLATGSELLEPFEPTLWGMDVAALRQAALVACAELERRGPDDFTGFDHTLIPNLDFSST